MTGMVTVKGQQRAIEIYGNVAKQGKTTEGRLILLTSFNKLIIANTILLLAADFSHFIGFLGPDLTYILRMIFRLAAMCAIAFGGLRLITT